MDGSGELQVRIKSQTSSEVDIAFVEDMNLV